MKKISFFGMLTAMIMVAVMSVFTACNKDDDGGSEIVGTWSGFDGNHECQMTVKFNSNGTGNLTETIYVDGKATPEVEASFTYTYSDEILTMVLSYYNDITQTTETVTDVFKCEINGKTMNLYYEGLTKMAWSLTKK